MINLIMKKQILVFIKFTVKTMINICCDFLEQLLKEGIYNFQQQVQHLNIFISLKMSDRYFSGSFPYTSDYGPTNYSHNRPTNQYQYSKPDNEQNNFDFKQSNISQQTIIHKAKLYSPDKSQQFFRTNFNNSQAYDKTKAKKSQITAKIHQIVDLCQDEKDAEVNQFKQVVQAQKRILNMLHQSNPHEQQNLYLNLTNFADSNQDRGTTFGPIKKSNQNHNMPKNQFKHLYQRQSSNNVKHTATRDNIYKKSAIDDLKTDRNAQEFASYQQNIQQRQPRHYQPVVQNKEQGTGRIIYVNDQTQKMIQQIQRKAMEQIQVLRNDKIQLMKRLNDQIKAHNQEKKLRVKLQNELDNLRNNQKLQHKQSFQNINNAYIRNNSNSRNQVAARSHNNRNQQNNTGQYQDINRQQYQNNQRLQLNHPIDPPNFNNQSTYNKLAKQEKQHQNIIGHSQPNRIQQNQKYQNLLFQHNSPKNKQIGQQNAQNLIYQNHLRDQSLMGYQKQISRLQIQNNNLMKTIKLGTTKNFERQQLRNQVAKLNSLILEYQRQIQRFRQQKANSSFQIQALLTQAGRIQEDSWKLRNKKQLEYSYNNLPANQKFSLRSNDFSNGGYENASNLSKKQIQYDDYNNRNKNAYGNKKEFDEDYRISLPNLGPIQDNKISEFERFINQLNRAAR